jgi:Na+-driven multidrug efflux pump
MFCVFFAQSLFGYFQAQQIVRYAMVTTVASVIAHIILILILCYGLNWGFVGMCYATLGMFVTRLTVSIL